jgi:hypothetical protein
MPAHFLIQTYPTLLHPWNSCDISTQTLVWQLFFVCPHSYAWRFSFCGGELKQTAGISKALSVSITWIPPAAAQASTPPELKNATPDTPVAADNKEKSITIKQLRKIGDDQYFSIGQLARLPEMINPSRHPLPNWPEQLPAEVIFRLWIDKSGRVNQVQPVTEKLPPSFIKAMRRYYLTMKFSAGFRPSGSINSTIAITLSNALAQ